MKTRTCLPTVSLLVLTAFAGASCAGEFGDGDVATDEPVDQETSPLFYAGFWIDDPGQPTPQWANLAVGMARNYEKTYTWYSDGSVCRGTNTVLCADGWWDYSAPDNNKWKAIRAVAFDPLWGRVYAWYEDARYTIGSPTVLRSISDKQAFALPPRPGGGTFSMGDLIDAYCTSNLFSAAPSCVYYWKNGWNPETTTIWRTTGTPGNSVAHSNPKQVTNTRSHGDIVGIDMNPDNGKVYTWYSDGRINISTDSLNLAQ